MGEFIRERELMKEIEVLDVGENTLEVAGEEADVAEGVEDFGTLEGTGGQENPEAGNEKGMSGSGEDDGKALVEHRRGDGRKKERMVPLKALEAERRKYKEKLGDPEIAAAREIAKKLREVLGIDAGEIQKALGKLSPEEAARELGVSEQAAEVLRESREELESVKAQIRRQDLFSQFYELGRNPFYADALDYRQELEEHALENNCDIKTAYNVLFAEQKFEEIRRSTEQSVLEGLERKKSRRVDAFCRGDGNGMARAVTLSKDQAAVAEAYGMSAEDYEKYSRQAGVGK